MQRGGVTCTLVGSSQRLTAKGRTAVRRLPHETSAGPNRMAAYEWHLLFDWPDRIGPHCRLCRWLAALIRTVRSLAPIEIVPESGQRQHEYDHGRPGMARKQKANETEKQPRCGSSVPVTIENAR
jgi:hypothetical protein